MKAAMKYICMILLGIVTLAICMTMYGRETRKKELQNNVHNVAEQTVAVACATKEYEIQDKNVFLSDFIENLSMSIVTDSDIEVEVYGVDIEKGLLSVNVVENYQHPNGANGKVEYGRTVIFDKKEEVEEMHTVIFYLASTDTECYMSYNVHTGEAISAPVDPQESDKNFVGWQDENGYLADFTQPVEQDITYYAMWN